MNKPLPAEELESIRVSLQSGSLAIAFAETSVDSNIHANIVMNEKLDDFATVWQTGRLLHNMERPEDAVFYLQQAAELEPQNAKVSARLIELYLDLHEQMPNRGYDIYALKEATHLISLEQSDFTQNLYDQAYGHVGLRSLRDGIQHEELAK